MWSATHLKWIRAVQNSMGSLCWARISNGAVLGILGHSCKGPVPLLGPWSLSYTKITLGFSQWYHYKFFPSHSGEWEKGFLYLDRIFQGVAEIWWIIGLDGWETNRKLIIFHPLQGFKALISSRASASKNKKILPNLMIFPKGWISCTQFFLLVFHPKV